MKTFDFSPLRPYCAACPLSAPSVGDPHFRPTPPPTRLTSLSAPHKLQRILSEAFAPPESDPNAGPDQSGMERFIPSGGDPIESVEVKTPKDWHKVAARLLLNGLSPYELAKTLGKTVQHVNLLKQELWFQRFLQQLSAEQEGPVQGLLRSMGFDALFSLHNMAMCAKNETVRRSAASDLLDRCESFLKFKVRERGSLEDEGQTFNNPQEEAAHLDRQLAQLKENL